MAEFVVLEDFQAAGFALTAGETLDDQNQDIDALTAAGVALVPRGGATQARAVAAFRAQARSRKSAGLLPILMGAHADEITLQRTRSRIVLFVDPQFGNDSNSGLNAGDAKLTLDGAFAEVPYFVEHPVLINVAGGTLEMPQVIGPFEQRGAPIVVQATEFTEILTGTCQAGTGDLAIETTGGMTIDEHFGRTIEVTDLATGRVWRRTINSNDVDTIVPNYSFFGAAAENAAFRVLENATTLQLQFTAIADGDDTAATRSRIVGVGKTSGNPFGGDPITTLEAIVFAGFDFTGPAFFRIEDSAVIFYGCKLVGAAPITRIGSDERSLIAAGMDLLNVGQFRSTLPHVAGALDPDAPDFRQWSGWGLFNDGAATDVQEISLVRFLGFLSANSGVRVDQATWGLVGGRIVAATASALVLGRECRMRVIGIIGQAPLSIECSFAGAEVACVSISGTSVGHFANMTIKKTNQGYGILALSESSGGQMLPGFGSLSGVTLEGVTDASAAENALCVSGGARIHFRPGLTVLGTWVAETAVRPQPLTTSIPTATATIASFTTDGDAIPPAAAGVDGRNGFIQRH